nr:PREDICTED: zinc finger protein 627-like [Bemisia tabaci]
MKKEQKFRNIAMDIRSRARKHENLFFNMKLMNESMTDANRPFKCDICGASYKHYTNLRSHQNSHTGETYCAICQKGLGTKPYFRTHMLKVHGIAM